jgi:TLC ATP/ADP transporter
VVTAPGSGAEIIPFLKTWVNLPAAIGFTVLYAKVMAGGCARLLVCPVDAFEKLLRRVSPLPI